MYDFCIPGLLLQLLVLAATPVTCDRAADHHLRYRRQALENTTTPGHEGEPPTTVLQQQRYSDPGGGAPDLREAGGEVLPSPAPGVNHPGEHSIIELERIHSFSSCETWGGNLELVSRDFKVV